MPCTRRDVPGGFVITCSSGRARRCSCGRQASLLCDWKLKGRFAGSTCDAPLCPACTFVPAPGKDLCSAHRTAYELWKATHQ